MTTMKKYIAFCCCIFVTALFNNCTEEKIIDETKGSIVGFIKLIDEIGIDIKDKSGIKITLDATHSTTTNAAGKFTLTDIVPGNYRISIEKDGYGTVKKFNYLFAGGKTPGVVLDITLVGLSKLALTSKQLSVVADNTVRINGTMTETSSYYFIYFFTNKPDGDVGSASSSLGYSFCCGPVTSFDHTISIPPGLSSPVYISGYVGSSINQQGQYSYYDYEKGQYINPAIKKLFDPIKVR
jgi:hypothetical protein